MTHLTPFSAHPGHWRLGGRELAPGDVIEVLLVDTWCRARVQNGWGSHDFQLLIDEHAYGMLLMAGRPARWLGTDGQAEGHTAERPGR